MPLGRGRGRDLNIGALYPKACPTSPIKDIIKRGPLLELVINSDKNFYLSMPVLTD